MKSSLLPTEKFEADQNPPEKGENERATVLDELDKILASRFFKSSDRSKQFLRFVVFSKLEGHADRLKERTIGSEVFHRPAGYATGEDPVVRVQAGEVRRRLEQYYRDLQPPSPLRIELPVGSYSPIFHFGSSTQVLETPPRPAIAPALPAQPRKPLLRFAIALAAVIVVAFAARALFNSTHRAAAPKTALERFWGPAIASQQPVLICIANATDHSIEEGLLGSQARSRSSKAPIGTIIPNSLEADGKFNLEGLPISSEIVPAADSAVAFALSGLFGRLDRPSQLRIGTGATYEDLRSFPAVIIGGFNSRWTMQLVSNLHFAFLRENGQYMIREEIDDGRVFTSRLGPKGETLEDFAIVGRLIDSKTGQFTVTVAGIGPRGTQAAGEFVTSTRFLQEGLANAPADWQNRNLEVLLQTTVTDSMAGPPHVIATYAW